MSTFAKRAIGVVTSLVGLALTVSGVWFWYHLGTSGTATFTGTAPAAAPVVIAPDVLNRVDGPVTVTARTGGTGEVWMGKTIPADARNAVGGKEHLQVTGVGVRDWSLTTRSSGAGTAPDLSGADLWRDQAAGPGSASLVVRQADAPETVVIRAADDDVTVTLSWSRTTWFAQSLVLIIAGLLILGVGLLTILQGGTPGATRAIASEGAARAAAMLPGGRAARRARGARADREGDGPDVVAHDAESRWEDRPVWEDRPEPGDTRSWAVDVDRPTQTLDRPAPREVTTWDERPVWDARPAWDERSGRDPGRQREPWESTSAFQRADEWHPDERGPDDWRGEQRGYDDRRAGSDRDHNGAVEGRSRFPWETGTSGSWQEDLLNPHHEDRHDRRYEDNRFEDRRFEDNRFEDRRDDQEDEFRWRRGR